MLKSLTENDDLDIVLDKKLIDAKITKFKDILFKSNDSRIRSLLMELVMVTVDKENIKLHELSISAF